MVEALIKNVRAAEQSVIAYWKKLKPHYAGHEEAPLWMACLAAFPVAITIDLLYQLWANFRLLKDKNGREYQLPPLVVNDCILSSLFSIAGKDLYEMPSDTRAFLLSVLRQRFGDDIMADLASFLYKYIREKRTGDFPGNYYDAQEWTALLTVDPQEAAINILSTLKEKLDEDNQLESIGVTNLLTALVKENHDLAEIMRQALDKKNDPVSGELMLMEDEGAPYLVRKSIHIKPATSDSGTHIEIPAALSSSLLPLYEIGRTAGIQKEGPVQKKGVVYAVMIEGKKDDGNLNACIDFCRLLNDKLRLVDAKYTYLLAGSPDITKGFVIETLEMVLSQAAEDDTVLIYYKGDAKYSNSVNYLQLEDSRHFDSYSEDVSRALSSEEYKGMVARHATNRPAIVTILDGKDFVLASWQPEDKRKFILLTPGDTALFGQTVSSFTNTLIDILSNNRRDLTYKEIIRRLTEKHIPGIIMQPGDLDNYFLTDIRKSETLLKQGFLQGLEFNLIADGMESIPYQKALNEFISRYALPPETDKLWELRNARLLKDQSRITVYYLSFFEDWVEGETSPPRKIVQSVNNMMHADGRLIIIREELPSSHDMQVGTNIIEGGHLILLGLNDRWINDSVILQSVLGLVNLLRALNKEVQFIIESDCDWRSVVSGGDTVYPFTSIPVNHESGMKEMLTQLRVGIRHLQRYLKQEQEPVQVINPEIERRIRDARKYKMLDLRGLSLNEIPQEVFQLDGLNSMDVSDNKITSIPREIGQLQTLHRLNVADNPIEVLPEEIGNLFHLEELNLRGTNLHQLPCSIGQLINLNTLYIDQTNIRVLNVGAFTERIPDNITYGYPGLLNLPPSGSVSNYFNPVHTKEFSILEIHSEHARPRYNMVPKEVTRRVHYGFHSEVESLLQLFKIIYTRAGTQHTIVYLCDEKNILLPQFGEQSDRNDLIKQYFQAFGKPLNLIINNPELYRGDFPNLTRHGILNFLALSKWPGGNPDFPDQFFETMWQGAGAHKASKIYLAYSSLGLREEGLELKRSLSNTGYQTVLANDYLDMDSDYAIQMNVNVALADIVILIMGDRPESRAYWTKINEQFIAKHYGAALKNRKRVLIFLQDELSGFKDSYVEHLLAKYRALQFVTRFSSVNELVEKVQLAIESSQLVKHDDNSGISLLSTVRKVGEKYRSDDRETGYQVFFNLEMTNDFSLPFVKAGAAGKKKPAKQPVTKKAKTPAKTGASKHEVAIKPFNGGRVLVVGTGSKTKITAAERSCARAVGKMLAAEGFRLICGGWGGVDYEVCNQFEQVYDLHKVSVKSRLLQVLGPFQTRFGNGDIVKVEKTSWNKVALENAMAVVVIGGSSLTSSSYVEAMTAGIPVIPIPGTGSVAAMVYDNLINSRRYKFLFPKQLMLNLQGETKTRSQAEDIAEAVLNILKVLPLNRLSAVVQGTTSKPRVKAAKAKAKAKPKANVKSKVKSKPGSKKKVKKMPKKK